MVLMHYHMFPSIKIEPQIHLQIWNLNLQLINVCCVHYLICAWVIL